MSNQAARKIFAFNYAYNNYVHSLVPHWLIHATTG